jgi:uracil-DNA glycosylase family 4
MKDDFKTLRELHEYYAVNNKCPLKKEATQPVYETNPPSSGIVFIGEAPGRNEDLQGKPFVGAAGKLLNTLLEGIGFCRDDVYITNTVKYRPPDNRDPSDAEKQSCRRWLNSELIFVKPKVIVPLGKHAFTKFVPEEKISIAHGRVFEHSSGIPIFAMYHPAAGLYNPGLRPTLQEDFQRLNKFLNMDPEKQKVVIQPKDDRSEEIDDILKL